MKDKWLYVTHEKVDGRFHIIKNGKEVFVAVEDENEVSWNSCDFVLDKSPLTKCYFVKVAQNHRLYIMRRGTSEVLIVDFDLNVISNIGFKVEEVVR